MSPTRSPRATPVANFLGEHNAARQQPGNLLEYHCASIALDRHHVLLIVLGGDRAHRIAELAWFVLHAGDNAGNGRTVHVHVEHIKKMLMRVLRLRAVLLHDSNVGDLAVGGRNDGPLHRRNLTLGIAKEPEKKRRQQQWDNGQGGQVSHPTSSATSDKGQSVIDAVANHGLL